MFRSPMLTAIKFLSYLADYDEVKSVTDSLGTLHCSKPKAEKTITPLVKHGLVVGRQGRNGGYVLTAKGRAITVGELAKIYGYETGIFQENFLTLPVFLLTRKG